MNLKNDDEVKMLIERAFAASKGEDLGERIKMTVEDLRSFVTDQLGSGVYVKGILNPDAGGVSFYFKQPAIARRIEHFIETSQEADPIDDTQSTMSLDDNNSSGEPQDEDDDDDESTSTGKKKKK